MKRAFDLIVCDVDGCLAAEHGGNLDLASLAKLAAYNAKVLADGSGPPITVCTGRPQPFAEAMCRLLHNDRVPCIAEMGVWLYHPGTNQYQADPTITRVELDAIHAAARQLDLAYRPLGVTHQPGKSASVTLYHPDPCVLESILPEVRDRIAAEGWPLRVSMTWNYINCDLQQITKGTGLDRLAAATGIPLLRMAGIGDTSSDRPMAEKLGWFGCPANASPEIAMLAHRVSAHHEVAGVLDLVAEIAGPAWST